MRWSKEEVEFLKKNYSKLSYKEIGIKLGRSEQAVDAKRHQLKLRRKGSGPNFHIPTCNPKIRPVDAAYIAGFIDGEGYLGVERGKRYSKQRCVVYNTCIEVLDWIKNTINCGYIREVMKTKNRTCYQLDIAKTRDLLILLPQIIPYMKVKKNEAKALYEFCKAKFESNMAAEEPKEVKHEI